MKTHMKTKNNTRSIISVLRGPVIRHTSLICRPMSRHTSL
jgi:hypothetical protein